MSKAYKRISTYLKQFCDPRDPHDSSNKAVFKLAKELDIKIQDVPVHDLERLGSSLLKYCYDQRTHSRTEPNSWARRKFNLPGLSTNITDHGRVESNRVIFEPYRIQEEDIQNLLEVCSKNNKWFMITGYSRHFPGQTIKITIGELRT